MKTGFISFNHDRQNQTGSARIRVENLIKSNPEEFETFKVGKKYDAIVFQKYYWHEYAKFFDGVKILDVCDPDWLTNSPDLSFVKMLGLVDGVVANTEATAEYLRKITDKPVIVIEDRHDMGVMRKYTKYHQGRAKSVVWFGYSHNASILEPYIPKLEEHNLDLTIISDRFVTISKPGEDYRTHESFVQWIDLEQALEEMMKHDFALLPIRRRANEQYKSDNKVTQALSIGLPVAHFGDDIDRLIEPLERIKEQNEKMEKTREDYDCRKSAEQMKEFIERLANEKKTKNS